MGFGECPKCGKMTLVKRKRRLHYLFGGAPGDLVLEVKCVNPECDFEEEIGVVEEEEVVLITEEEDEDIEEEEEEF